MREGIHPEWYPAATVTCACGNTWTTGATIPEIRTDVCSNCHPFYTGEQRIVDTEGQVDRFMKRLQARENLLTNTQTQTATGPSLDVALDELELGTRVISSLADADIVTVGDFLDTYEDQGEEGILAIKGFGRKSLIDVKKRLREAGYEIASAEETA